LQWFGGGGDIRIIRPQESRLRQIHNTFEQRIAAENDFAHIMAPDRSGGSRLLPLERPVAGWESHPLKFNTFSRRTESLGYYRPTLRVESSLTFRNRPQFVRDATPRPSSRS